MDEKARQMYQIAAEGTSGSEAIWPKMGLAITSIRLKDYQTAEPLTEQIPIDFAADDRLSTACCLIADAYRSTRHHRQAIDLYQYVIDKHGDSEYAMWSQMGIAICNIDLGKKDAAESAIEKLRTNYADHPSFYKAVRDIGDNYRYRDIHDKVCQMYQLALAGLSGSEAFWPKAGIAIASVHLKDYQTADALTEQIRTEFASHPQLPEAICLIAGAYRNVMDYDKALDLYQLILKLWPRSEQALWTKAGIVRIAVALGDEAAVQEAIDNMIADFKDHPALSAALWAIAEEYYDLAFQCEKGGRDTKGKEYFAKVISLGETVRQQLMPSTAAAEAWFFSGECYYRLGQYEKAIEYYEKVVQNWPDYEYAWLAQHRIVKMYKWLLVAGVMSDSEAEAAMKIAYEQLLASYPDCPAAKSGRTWLDQYYRQNRGEQK